MPDILSQIDLSPKKDVSAELADATIQLRIRDYTEKLDSRRTTKWILVALLFLQNFSVYGLVAWALLTEKLPDLQLVLGIVISATLGETYLMVKIMIEWLFKDIDYK